MRKLSVPVLLAALALAGCGGGDDNGGGGGGNVAKPTPAEPISAVVPQFNKAIKHGSCEQIERLTFSQLRLNTTPGAAPSAKECAAAKQGFKNLTGTRFTKSHEYGTAAVMEGPPKVIPKGAPKGLVAQAIFLLDRDRKWRFFVSNVDRTQIGVKPTPGAVDNGKNAQAVIDAVRDKDCKRFEPLVHPTSLKVGAGPNATPATVCKQYVDGKIFAPSVRATKDPKPELLGQTRDLVFYGVPTKKSYFTMVMVTPPGTSDKPPLLFGVFLNTDNPALPKTQG